MSSVSLPVTPPGPLPTPDWAALPRVVSLLRDRADEHDRDGSFPEEGVAAVHKAGLLTSTVGRAYGGPGHGVSDTARMLQSLGQGDPSVALITCMTLLAHAAQAAAPTWPLHLYQEVLQESRHGPVLINTLRVEPDLGTPARGGLPATVARRSRDGWVISGRKIYSTGSVGLRWMIVWARTDESTPRVGSFFVRSDSPGITIEHTWDHLGLRASASHDVVLTDVVVPREAADLSEPGVAPSILAAQRSWLLAFPALYLGVARAALDWLVGFLHERVPSALGAPLATLPRFHTAVGEIEARISGAEEIVYAVAARADAGDSTAHRRVGIAKLLATRAAISAVEYAVALVGNPGLTHHNPLQRHYRDVLCARVHTPQDDTILSESGRAVIEGSASA